MKGAFIQKQRQAVLFLFLAVVFMSCKTDKYQGSTDKADSLFYRWDLSILGNKAVEHKQADDIPYLEFAKDNKVFGFSGCNRLFGSYTVNKDGRLSFGNVATTRMACPDRDELEARFLDALNNVAAYSIKGGVLSLQAENGKDLAVFTKTQQQAEIINKYWKLISLNGKKVKLAENQEQEQSFMLKGDNTFSGFAGCNQFTGQFAIKKENKIAFKNIAVTMRLCPDLDINEDEFLRVFDAADNYTIDGDILKLNTEKKVPLAVFEAIYF